MTFLPVGTPAGGAPVGADLGDDRMDGEPRTPCDDGVRGAFSDVMSAVGLVHKG